MVIIDAEVKVLKESDPFKKIELAGRTCYKSEENITEGSARKFVKGMMERKHVAMLEHATFVFQVDPDIFGKFCVQYSRPKNLGSNHAFLNHTYNDEDPENVRCLISGNLRAINESCSAPLIYALYKYDEDLVYPEHKAFLTRSLESSENLFGGKINILSEEDIADLTYEERLCHEYHSIKFVVDRGVSHEIVRHRPASFAQESTRYCNYSKDKFGNSITVIRPLFFKEDSVEMAAWESAMHSVEKSYFSLLEMGCTPQQARTVLPNSLKTEIIMTANVAEWKHFLNLRSRGITGAPHPQMKEVADMVMSEIGNRVYEDLAEENVETE